jgi:hypothetical protein
MEKEGQGSKVDKMLDGLTRFSRPVPWVLSSLVPSIMPLLGGNRRKTLFKDEHDHKFPPPRTLPSLRKNGLARPCLGADGQALSSLYSNPKPNLVDGMKWLQNTLKLVKCVMPERKSRAGRSSLERKNSHGEAEAMGTTQEELLKRKSTDEVEVTLASFLGQRRT